MARMSKTGFLNPGIAKPRLGDYVIVELRHDSQVAFAASGFSSAAAAAQALPIECLETTITARRGFQILGPEGWRTFDQDERLMLVMSADAQPLIGTLKELSQRLIRSREATVAFQRPLAEERLRVAHTNNEIDARQPSGPRI